jgi:hypothetical protein
MDERPQEYIRQNRKKIGIFVVFVILIFLIALGIIILSRIHTNLPIVSSNKTIYVAGDGSGDFNCNGSDDQIEINQALAYVEENPQFTTVHLRGPNTYIISNSIFIGNNTVLEGDPTAVIKLENKADWPAGKPMIKEMNSAGIHGVTIKGFEIYGNHDNNEDKKNGEGYYNMIRFLYSKDIQIHDMYMHDGHGDGLIIRCIN